MLLLTFIQNCRNNFNFAKQILNKNLTTTNCTVDLVPDLCVPRSDPDPTNQKTAAPDNDLLKIKIMYPRTI